MSWGFTGSIGGPGLLSTYALSICFRIESLNQNVQRCHCKGCGDNIDQGEGFQVLAMMRARSLRECYFCASCTSIVKEATEQFPSWPDRKQPAWWSKVGKPGPRIKRTERPALRPSRQDLERQLNDRISNIIKSKPPALGNFWRHTESGRIGTKAAMIDTGGFGI